MELRSSVTNGEGSLEKQNTYMHTHEHTHVPTHIHIYNHTHTYMIYKKCDIKLAYTVGVELMMAFFTLEWQTAWEPPSPGS